MMGRLWERREGNLMMKLNLTTGMNTKTQPPASGLDMLFYWLIVFPLRLVMVAGLFAFGLLMVPVLLISGAILRHKLRKKMQAMMDQMGAMNPDAMPNWNGDTANPTAERKRVDVTVVDVEPPQKTNA